jgi:hypothetical protein
MGDSRQSFYGPVHAFRNHSHFLSELPTQFLFLQGRRITPPDEKMEHILEIAVPKLLQSIPTKQKESLVMIAKNRQSVSCIISRRNLECRTKNLSLFPPR